jgi:hypothetical protein
MLGMFHYSSHLDPQTPTDYPIHNDTHSKLHNQQPADPHSKTASHQHHRGGHRGYRRWSRRRAHVGWLGNALFGVGSIRAGSYRMGSSLWRGLCSTIYKIPSTQRMKLQINQSLSSKAF